MYFAIQSFLNCLSIKKTGRNQTENYTYCLKTVQYSRFVSVSNYQQILVFDYC